MTATKYTDARELAYATGIIDGTGTLYIVCAQAILDGEGTAEDVRRIWREATEAAAREHRAGAVTR